MVMKIDASIEEIKSWVSEEDVFYVLTAFDLIERKEGDKMTNEQIELFFELARTQLLVTDTEEEWDSYIEGVTDTLYILQMKNDMNSLEKRLLQMWERKVMEGMI